MNVKKYLEFYGFLALAAVFSFLLACGSARALTAGETYTITMSKLNSDGTTTEVSSTTATADDDGKIDFSLNGVPASPTTNFIALEVTDSNGNSVRKGFAPAPPAGSENLLGINSVSTSQTDALLRAGIVAGSDDPILVAYALVITKVPDISTDDVDRLATLGNAAIRGIGGFEDFLADNGVSSSQLNSLRNNLVYNSDPNAKDLSDFTAKFKASVDNNDDSEMAKAGGYMAEIFMDAGNTAGIDPTLILSAHDAAGEVTMQAEYLQIQQGMSDDLQNGMEQAMNSFYTRIAATKLETEYTDALNILDASGSQVDSYNTAVQTMITAFEAIDTTFSEYFMDPAGFVADDNGYDSHQAVQDAMDTLYDNAFTQFQTDIQSSDDDVATMKQNVADALAITVNDLPPDFGTMRDFNDQVLNWPIPQAVMVNWVAGILSDGGNLTFTRWDDDDLAVPDSMAWLNNDTGTRTDFTNQGMPDSFAAMMGLEEDIRIIEFTRYSTWDGMQQQALTQEEMKALEKAAGLAFQQRIDQTVEKIGGTADGTTSISDARKKAMIKLIQQPSLH